MKILVATKKEWKPGIIKRLEARLACKCVFLDDRNLLTIEWLKQHNPKYIFFIHWSCKIPKAIYSAYECVIFHMTDLPFGRGGSPLQNLICREIYETKISAVKCEEEIDAGPIYTKKELSLHGRAEDIYIKATEIIEDMIVEIVNNKLTPMKQEGDVVSFVRRKPQDGSLSCVDELRVVYDYIRMLDAEGYPSAFLNHNSLHLDFKSAKLGEGYVDAQVRISIRKR